MRNPADLHTGDDWTPAITLKVDDSAYAVPSGATVRAAITDQDGLTILAGPVTVLEATSGSDWANGVIVPIFPAAQTDNLPTGYLRIEVEVEADGNVSTWSQQRVLKVKIGTITNLTIEPAPGEDLTLAALNALVVDATLIDTTDSRLSDARTPTAHAASHATGGGDAIAPADIGAATSAQGDLADTATQPGDLATVATTGDYADLSGTPTIPSALSDLSDADTTGVQDGEALLYVAANSRFEPGAVGGGSAAGSDGQIQFALSGGFSADAGLAYNSTTKALTVGGATVTTDSPVLNLAQTWNAAGVTFTALKLNVTDTDSAADSPLVDLQVNSASKFQITKEGRVASRHGYVFGKPQFIDASLSDSAGFQIINSALAAVYVGSSGPLLSISSSPADGVRIGNERPLGWLSNNAISGPSDLRLYRDAAHVLAQRLDTNPQTFRIANTWTDASNLEQLSIGWAANVCTIATEALGTGTKRNLVLDGANRAAYSETAADIAAALVAHGIMSSA